MTGGLAYILDETGDFELKLNRQLVGVAHLEAAEDIELLHHLVVYHLDFTKSKRTHAILDRWDHYLGLFGKVEPLSEIGRVSIANISRLMEEPSEEVTATP